MTKLNSRQVHTWSMHWPRFGQWRADLILTDGDIIAKGEAATITSESLTMVGKVLRSGMDAADRPHITVVGGLGWQKTVAAPVSFQSDSGVQLRTVLSELAGYAGEEIVLPPDSSIGDYYELAKSHGGEPVRYADALNELVAHGGCPGWHTDPDGKTRFGARESREVATRATPLANNKGVGVSTYGIDDPGEFIPENTISGEAIDRIDLRETDGKFEVDVFTSASVASMREQVRRMVAHELSDRARTYIVVSCGADGRCDLRPPPDAPHLPEMRNVEQWIMGGGEFKATEGDLAIVEFRDERKTRPIITGFRRRSGSDATSYPQAARIGDMVQSGGIMQACNFSDPTGSPLAFLVLVNGTPTPLSGPYLISFGALPGPLPPTLVSSGPLYGTIASGSALLGIKTA